MADPLCSMALVRSRSPGVLRLTAKGRVFFDRLEMKMPFWDP